MGNFGKIMMDYRYVTYTICPKITVQFKIATHNIKIVETSWTYGS